MRMIVTLLVLAVAGLGGTLWLNQQKLADRDQAIESMKQLNAKLQEKLVDHDTADEAANDQDRDDVELIQDSNAQTLRERLEALRDERDRYRLEAVEAQSREEMIERELRDVVSGSVDPAVAQTDLGELQIEATMLRHERDAARTQIDLLLTQNTSLQDEAAGHGRSISIDDHILEIDALQQQIGDLQIALRDAQSQADLLSEQAATDALAASEGADHNDQDKLDQIAALNAMVAASQSTIEELTTALEDATNQISTLKGDIAKLEEQQRAAVEKISDEREQLLQQLETNVQQIDELNAARDAARNEVEALQASQDSLFSSDDLLIASTEAARSVEVKFRDELERVEAEATDAETRISDLNQERAAMRAKLTTLEQQNARLQEERNTIVRAGDDIVDALEAERQSLIAQHADELAQLSQEKTGLSNRLDDLQARLAEAELEVEGLRTATTLFSQKQSPDVELASDLATIKGNGGSITEASSELERTQGELNDLRERMRQLERFVNDHAPPRPVIAPRSEL